MTIFSRVHGWIESDKCMFPNEDETRCLVQSFVLLPWNRHILLWCMRSCLSTVYLFSFSLTNSLIDSLTHAPTHPKGVNISAQICSCYGDGDAVTPLWRPTFTRRPTTQQVMITPLSRQNDVTRYVLTTSLLRHNDAVTSFWSDNDVIITWCVR